MAVNAAMVKEGMIAATALATGTCVGLAGRPTEWLSRR